MLEGARAEADRTTVRNLFTTDPTTQLPSCHCQSYCWTDWTEQSGQADVDLGACIDVYLVCK